MKRVCGCFDKRQYWTNEGASVVVPIAGKKLGEVVLTQLDETRKWLESGTVLANVASGPAGGATLEELTKMVQDHAGSEGQRG